MKELFSGALLLAMIVAILVGAVTFEVLDALIAAFGGDGTKPAMITGFFVGGFAGAWAGIKSLGL